MHVPLPLQSLIFKVKLSVHGIASVLKAPKYLILAVLVSLLFTQFIFWLLNLGLLQYITTTVTLTFVEKIKFFLEMTLVFIETADTLQGFLLLSISILQGIAVALIAYSFRSAGRIDRKSMSGSTLASLGAMIGLGCAACGTSLIVPVITIFFSGSAYAIADTVGIYASIIALLVAVYAVYRLGYVAYGQSSERRA